MSAVEKPPAPMGEQAPNSVEPPIEGAPAQAAAAADQDAVPTGAAKGDAKKPLGKDRKPRRERPPLPDPLPEKLVQKYPEPSKADLQKKIDVHDLVIKECFNKLSASRAFYDKRAKIREAGKEEFDAARKRMSAKNEELKELFERRKDYSMQIKNIRDQESNARQQEAASSTGKESEALRNLKTVAEVDARIKELETRQHTESMSILEEKKLVALISYLKHTGRNIIVDRDNAFQQGKAAKVARAEKRSELEAQRKQLDKKIDAEKATLEDFKKEVDAIRAKQDEEIKKIQEETQNIDRDKIKEQITEAKAEIRKLRDEFSVELDKWYLNERIYVEQIKVQKRKRWEAQQAEREARRKKWEEEQAQYPEPDPYQKEKDMISGLTVYLQTILGEITEKTAGGSLLPKSNAPNLKTDKCLRTVSTAGKAVGKSVAEQFESLAFSDFVGKKSKAKGKKGRRNSLAVGGGGAPGGGSAGADDENLKPCPIDLLRAFTHLEIVPPNKLSEVRPALEAVKKKKEYYDGNPPLPEPESEPKAEGAKKKPAPKANGKVPVKDITSSGAFPGLNGANDSPKAADDSAGASVAAGARPSFSEIAKGSAVAPAPPVSATAYPTIAEEAVMSDTPVSAAVDPTPVAPQAVAFTES